MAVPVLRRHPYDTIPQSMVTVASSLVEVPVEERQESRCKPSHIGQIKNGARLHSLDPAYRALQPLRGLPRLGSRPRHTRRSSAAWITERDLCLRFFAPLAKVWLVWIRCDDAAQLDPTKSPQKVAVSSVAETTFLWCV